MTLARKASFQRFAQLCALFAILAYQPLAALHFASDEAHHSNPATSIQVAAHSHHHAHDHSGEPPGGHTHQGHADPLCDFCIACGVSLPPLPSMPAFTVAGHRLAGQAPTEAIRADRRLRIGHPVRAPPRTV